MIIVNRLFAVLMFLSIIAFMLMFYVFAKDVYTFTEGTLNGASINELMTSEMALKTEMYLSMVTIGFVISFNFLYNITKRA